MNRLFKFVSNSKNIRYYSTVSTDEVIFTKKGKSLNVLLNRPKALNALNPGMVSLLTPKYKEFQSMKDGDLVVIMKGSGEKAFCAGGDIRAIYDYKMVPSTRDNSGKDIGDLFFREEYILNNLIGTSPIPQVSIYNGFAMGGGIGLSVHGKYRIATDNTLFAMPETSIGFFCDVGGSYFLPRLSNGFGMYLALTGNKLKGKNVYASGIATHFIPSDKLSEMELELSQLDNPTSINVESCLTKYTQPITDQDKQSLEYYTNLSVINKIFGDNSTSVQQIIDNLELENSDWSKSTLKTLQSVSPSSLMVVFEQMKRGAKLSTLAQCLEMEFRISQHFLDKPDFFEGVRALLVDKDKNPKWNPSSINQISKEVVNSYFNPLSQNKELKL